jgi:uncharacterized protein (DUF608 family)
MVRKKNFKTAEKLTFLISKGAFSFCANLLVACDCLVIGNSRLFGLFGFFTFWHLRSRNISRIFILYANDDNKRKQQRKLKNIYICVDF